MSIRRMNLAAVEASLRAVQRAFPRINDRLSPPRDPLADEVVENMAAGYALVDELVVAGRDLFAIGNAKYWLELNNLVLCGASLAHRAEYAEHIEATARRFYEERNGGINDLTEWYALQPPESAWQRAAGLYVRILSRPQLFIEGNHRTGALAMSYILLREGQPPFVLTVDNALAFFDPSGAICDTSKQALATIFRSAAIKEQVARYLEEHADPTYLLDAASARA
jgi:hypothetical protein